MKLELNQHTCILKTYYNVLMEYSYRLGHYDDDFLNFCYEQAKNEFLDNENILAVQYESTYARVIIEAAEFLEKTIADNTDEDDWNALFQEVE